MPVDAFFDDFVDNRSGGMSFATKVQMILPPIIGKFDVLVALCQCNTNQWAYEFRQRSEVVS